MSFGQHLVLWSAPEIHRDAVVGYLEQRTVGRESDPGLEAPDGDSIDQECGSRSPPPTDARGVEGPLLSERLDREVILELCWCQVVLLRGLQSVRG